MPLDISHLTLLFMATVCALAMAFVWMFYEFERRFGRHVVAVAQARIGIRLGSYFASNENRRD
jgi:hypothetical protein